MAAASSTPVDRILKDLQECIANIQQEFQENTFPITDDNTLLHRFCAKIEFLLQHGQKEKTTLLGTKKEYWDFFCVCLRSNRAACEGLRFVKSKSEIKSSLGRGRGFIRFCLVHKCLADSLQHCFSNTKLVNDWYNEMAIWCQPHKWTPLVSSLYEFSDVNFALSPEGIDLDIAWPTFARKVFDMQYSWQPPSRSISISSLVSQNETWGGQSMRSDQDCDNDELKLELAQSQTEIAKLSAKLPVFQQREAEMRQRIEELEKELKTSESQVLLKESAKSEMVPDNSLGQEALELQFSDAEKAINLLKVQLEQKNSSIESLNSTVQSLEVKNTYLTKELANVNKDHDCTVQKLAAMSEKVQDFSGRLETTEKDLCQVMDGKKELLSKVDKMQSANENMKHLVTAMECQNQMLEQQVESLKENVFKYENDLKQANDKNTELKDQLAEVSSSVQDFSHQIDVKQIDLETARQKIVFLEEKVSPDNHVVELVGKVSELESINKSLIEEKNLLLSKIESSDVKASEIQTSDELRDDLEALLNEKTKQLVDANSKLQLLQNNTEKIMPFLEKHEFMIDSLKSEMIKMLVAAQKLCHDLNKLMPMVHNVTKKDSKSTELSSVVTASVNGSSLQEPWDSPNEQLPNFSLASETSHVLLGELDIHFFPLIRTVHRMIAKLRGLMKKQNGVEYVMNACQNMSCQLFNSLNDYERKVITASSLENAHNAIKGLTKEHQKLQAAEAILRYELREKRKLLTRLRQQLEVTREEWNRVKSKNVESHCEWNSLREEFAKRYKQASEESGFVDGTAETSESSSAVAETVGLDKPEEDDESSKLSNSPDELAPVCDGAEGVNEVTVEEADGEGPPRTRLEIMEEECQILYSSLVRSSQRSDYLVQRLNLLLSPSDHSSDSSKDSSPFPTESVENSEEVLSSDNVALSPLSDICNDGDVELNFNAAAETLGTQCLSDEILLSTSQHSTDLTFVQEDASYNGHLEFEDGQAEAEIVEVATDNSMRKRALEALVRRCKSERSEMECRETDLKHQLYRMELANNELKVKVTSLLQERHEASKKDNEFRKRAEFIFRHERDVSDVRVHSLSEEKTSLQKELKEFKEQLSTRIEYISSLEKDLEHARESLKECQESYEQDLSSLRFQLSTEALKYERSLKNYTEQESGISVMKDKVNNQEQLIQSLEVALSEIQDDRRVEQEKQWQELEELQFMLTARDEECIALNEEAKKAVKDLDDTKNALSQLHVLSKDQETKFKKTIRLLEVELAQWKKDNEDLKRQIIKLTKYVHLRFSLLARL